MICPYNRRVQTQVYQLVNDLVDEENGVSRGNQYVLRDEFEMMECPREGCAVWRNGACHYTVFPDDLF